MCEYDAVKQVIVQQKVIGFCFGGIIDLLKIYLIIPLSCRFLHSPNTEAVEGIGKIGEGSEKKTCNILLWLIIQLLHNLKYPAQCLRLNGFRLVDNPGCGSGGYVRKLRNLLNGSAFGNCHKISFGIMKKFFYENYYINTIRKYKERQSCMINKNGVCYIK